MEEVPPDGKYKQTWALEAPDPVAVFDKILFLISHPVKPVPVRPNAATSPLPVPGLTPDMLTEL